MANFRKSIIISAISALSTVATAGNMITPLDTFDVQCGASGDGVLTVNLGKGGNFKVEGNIWPVFQVNKTPEQLKECKIVGTKTGSGAGFDTEPVDNKTGSENMGVMEIAAYTDGSFVSNNLWNLNLLTSGRKHNILVSGKPGGARLSNLGLKCPGKAVEPLNTFVAQCGAFSKKCGEPGAQDRMLNVELGTGGSYSIKGDVYTVFSQTHLLSTEAKGCRILGKKYGRPAHFDLEPVDNRCGGDNIGAQVVSKNGNFMSGALYNINQMTAGREYDIIAASPKGAMLKNVAISCPTMW